MRDDQGAHRNDVLAALIEPSAIVPGGRSQESLLYRPGGPSQLIKVVEHREDDNRTPVVTSSARRRLQGNANRPPLTIGEITFRVRYDVNADVLCLHMGDPASAVVFDESLEGHPRCQAENRPGSWPDAWTRSIRSSGPRHGHFALSALSPWLALVEQARFAAEVQRPVQSRSSFQVTRSRAPQEHQCRPSGGALARSQPHTLSVTASKSLINPQLKKAYTSAKATFIDITDDTDAYQPLSQKTTLALYGSVPRAVATVCELT